MSPSEETTPNQVGGRFFWGFSDRLSRSLPLIIVHRDYPPSALRICAAALTAPSTGIGA
jgi:hypothetical protein